MEILCMLTYEHGDLAFQVLRVYAICAHKWQFALVVGGLNVWPVLFGIVSRLVPRSQCPLMISMLSFRGVVLPMS